MRDVGLILLGAAVGAFFSTIAGVWAETWRRKYVLRTDLQQYRGMLEELLFVLEGSEQGFSQGRVGAAGRVAGCALQLRGHIEGRTLAWLPLALGKREIMTALGAFDQMALALLHTTAKETYGTADQLDLLEDVQDSVKRILKLTDEL